MRWPKGEIVQPEDVTKIPVGSVIQNHKGEYGIVMPDGKVAHPYTKEQVEQIIGEKL